jgi:cobalt-zinc-cadmium efflux system outer membrane protein
MFQKNVCVTGILVLAGCSAAHAQEWTEQAVLELFDQQSPIKRESRAAAAAAVESLRSRTLWPNPVAFYSRETVGFTEFLQGEQQLPLSGRLRLTRKAMDPAGESAAAEGAARAWDARSSLRVAFYRSLAAQQQARLLDASLGEIGQILELLRLREREGEGSKYDRMRVEREAADVRADLAVAQARSRSEQAVLLAYLPSQTRVPELAGELAPRGVPTSREELLRQALATRAELRAQSLRLTQLGFEQQAAGRLRFPEPIVAGGLKRVQLEPNRNGSGAVVSVSVPLPLFNKGKTEVARLAAEKDRTQARADLLTQQISAAVTGAYDLYASRLAVLSAFERETQDSTELMRVARIGYEEGELGILQLLDAYRLERQRALRRLDLQAALKEAVIELSRSAGFEVTQ